MSFLVKQIPSHRMRVKVIWLGPNADLLVRRFVDDPVRRQAGRSIMFFAWRPSTITEGGKFLSLSFPQCETLSVTPDNGRLFCISPCGRPLLPSFCLFVTSRNRQDMRCAYEFQRFEKVSWSHVKKTAKLVFEVSPFFFKECEKLV